MNSCVKTCKAGICSMLFGIGLALFSLSPLGIQLEEEFGLSLLFKLRGPAQHPEDVIIVNIDKQSAEILHLHEDPEKWQRSQYATLIEKINQQSPALIAFNLRFDEKDTADDLILAKAMTQQNNVILSSYLKRELDKFNRTFVIQLITPPRILNEAALDTAPFVLPKMSTTIKQFFAYYDRTGEATTFPVTLFQGFLIKKAYSDIVQFFLQSTPSCHNHISSALTKSSNSQQQNSIIRTIEIELRKNAICLKTFQQKIQSSALPKRNAQLIFSWLNLLNRPTSLYFNYYGGAEAISSIPIYQVLSQQNLSPGLFKNKIVLVGHSTSIEPEATQGLYSVFSKSDNEETSSIEFAATAVANLIENTTLKPLMPISQFLLLLSLSLLISVSPRFLSYKQLTYFFLIISFLYLLISYTLFISKAIWIPLFIPIFIQMPIIMIILSIINFLRGSKDRQKMQQAFSLYVPKNVVNTITNELDINALNRYGSLMKGVCMSTDAGQYTTLSEQMEPLQLHHYLNDYYAAMFPQVEHHEGLISDVVGDAMFALWRDNEQTIDARRKACLAALDIKQAIEQFNSTKAFPLITRLGLHFGNIRLGNVGAAEHYEYRAVGDTVNTAARIEGLNKLLGTQILVSAEVIKNLPDFVSRELGHFILKGKSQPVHIYELMAKKDPNKPCNFPVLPAFSSAFNLFKNKQWANALTAWNAVAHDYPDDGPTLFYIRYLQQNINLSADKQDSKNQSTVIKTGNITTALHYQRE